jgi:hypothetical protein
MRGDRAILTLLGMTFVGLFIDVRYMHRFVLSMHWESKIPLYACGLALVAVVFAIFDHAKAKGIAAWLFAVVAVVGLVGVYEHTHFGDDDVHALHDGRGSRRPSADVGADGLHPARQHRLRPLLAEVPLEALLTVLFRISV